MRPWALEILRCPVCMAELACIDLGAQGEAVTVRTGLLSCSRERCHEWFPIVEGVPRMLREPLRSERFPGFLHAHRARIPVGVAQRHSQYEPTDPLDSVEQDNIRNFGFEWTAYARFGWDDPVYNIEREESIFRRKTLLGPDDLQGKLVLDAGCGNGRYSYWAARYGGRVVGVDLGDGVDSAARNTAGMDVQIVQGDIFALPFADASFDVEFAIGVLMHTGDPLRATACLASKLRPGGSSSIHVYGRGNVIYELVDRALRRRTTRMSLRELQRLTDRLFRLRRILEAARLARAVSRFVRIDPHPHCIFDWYAAPVATHHTYREVCGWLRENGLDLVETKESLWTSQPLLKRLLRPLVGPPITVTVRGSLPDGPGGD